ncbi:hypothetical protein GCM10007108_13490 [Thermogymnomonas acidicola]|uniref:Class I SAM-dependent methyltransferase n=1 Tax=Thermogymnomonas acidicola TaxID=399579 RepID=A0AA37F9Q8_9ARCH|nr:hypothetical protein GCM10007108_13490 [Thermogymnomonas acidicola]
MLRKALALLPLIRRNIEEPETRKVLAYMSTPTSATIKIGFRNGPKVSVTRTTLITVLHLFDLNKKLRVIGEKEIIELSEFCLGLDLKLRSALGLEYTNFSAGGRFGVKEAFLYMLVRKYRPNRLIETGVAQGVSSSVILKAITVNGEGHLTSIDLPTYSRAGRMNADGVLDRAHVDPSLGPGWVVPKDLRTNWSLILGDSKEKLKELGGDIDFFFHDSEHSYSHMMLEYEWALGHMRSGVICSDDISWNRAFMDFRKNHGLKEIEWAKDLDFGAVSVENY